MEDKEGKRYEWLTFTCWYDGKEQKVVALYEIEFNRERNVYVSRLIHGSIAPIPPKGNGEIDK